MPRPTRCAYREGKTQCRRIGQGNPPLCRPHRALLENDIGPTSVGQKLGDVLGKLFRGAKVTRDDLGEAFVDGLRMMGGAAQRAPGGVNVTGNVRSDGTASQGVFVDWAYEELKKRTAQQSAEQQAQAARKAAQAAEVAAARAELGFDKKTPITVAAVEKRRRELARKHHPDRGGSVTKMQRVNAAADLLIAHLEAKP